LRPIVWGLILSVLGGFFWILFSVVLGIAAGLSGQGISSFYLALVDITGLAMIFGIPGGIVGEIVRWYRRRKPKEVLRAPEVTQPSLPPSAGAHYCRQCGRQLRPGSLYCDQCGASIRV
jgi:hypothetical protein